MSYALIPDGYSLKKVTKAQKQALSDKRRHDNVLAILDNPTTVPILATTAATLLAGVAIDKFIEKCRYTVVRRSKKGSKRNCN